MADIAEPAQQSRPRKRQRPGLSCLECRRRKVKCNQARPCDQCTKGRRPGCTYGSRIDATEQSAQPWALGKPQSYGHSGDTGQTGPKLPSRVSASNAQGIMGSITGSPDSEHGADAIVKDQVSQPLPQPFPTPGTSPGMPLIGPEKHVTTSGSASISQTPRSDDNYPLRWIGLDQWNPPAQAPSSESIDDLRRRIHRMEHDVSVEESPVTKSTSSKPFVSDIIPHGDTAAHTLRGILSKTRLFGPSHWMCYFDQFEKIYQFSHSNNWTDQSEVSSVEVQDIHERLKKCKDLARLTKGAHKLYQPLVGTDLEQSVPSREICDELVQLYLNNFESTYRILHIPLFRREYAQYWDNPKSVGNGFVLRLLLVLSIGTSLYPNSQISLRSSVRQWIYAAVSWLSAPFEKSRLNLNGLQIYCLLLIARQVNAVESDLAWISAGSLLRTAMQMGLHRDPGYLPKMSVLCVELRRRLWATIIEMVVQSSLDSGMPALLSFNDFDTLPPSNIDDNELDETTEVIPRSKDRAIFTQTSLQVLLLQSLRLRHAIAALINDFHSEPSYDDILQLGKQMMAVCRESRLLMQTYAHQASFSGLSHSLTAFHRNLVDHLLHSFLLILHRPSARKAREDPKFYFSRKVCFETALALISPEPDEHYGRLMVVGSGLMRSIFIHSGSVICLEMITQLEEDNANMTLQKNKISREPLRQAVETMVNMAEKRVKAGETNVRGHMFYSMIMGQVEAMETGTSQERGICEGAKRSAEICYNLLKAWAPTPTTTSTTSTEAFSSHDTSTQPQASASGGDNLNAEFDVQSFGFDFLRDGILDSVELPDSWLFTDWDVNGEE